MEQQLKAGYDIKILNSLLYRSLDLRFFLKFPIKFYLKLENVGSGREFLFSCCWHILPHVGRVLTLAAHFFALSYLNILSSDVYTMFNTQMNIQTGPGKQDWDLIVLA